MAEQFGGTKIGLKIIEFISCHRQCSNHPR
jgi:hypothetical protein